MKDLFNARVNIQGEQEESEEKERILEKRRLKAVIFRNQEK